MSERSFLSGLFSGRQYRRPERALSEVSEVSEIEEQVAGTAYKKARGNNPALEYKGPADVDKMEKIRAARRNIENLEEYSGDSENLESISKFVLSNFANLDFSSDSPVDAEKKAKTFFDKMIFDLNKIKNNINNEKIIFGVDKNVGGKMLRFIFSVDFVKGSGFVGNVGLLFKKTPNT
ncbi:MAG: hypothetical protein PHQ18_00835 [Patescibacteria group bacterium]|nr:hypothetical protein [Patescibacteria group bacterium]